MFRTSPQPRSGVFVWRAATECRKLGGGRVNQAFVRCPHCGLPHEHEVEVCPSTRLVIPRSGAARGREAAIQIGRAHV